MTVHYVGQGINGRQRIGSFENDSVAVFVGDLLSFTLYGASGNGGNVAVEACYTADAGVWEPFATVAPGGVDANPRISGTEKANLRPLYIRGT